MAGEEWAEVIAENFSNATRSAICVVDSRLLDQNSGFREALVSLLGEKQIAFFQTWYDRDSVSAESHIGFDFPGSFGKKAVYLVDNSRSDLFYSYYSNVSRLPGGRRALENPLDTRYTEHYFVVSGGTLAE